jgi:chitinase
MCGVDSENGEMPCGMQLCCSAMGWCGVSGSLGVAVFLD